jgi:two-component sensor histidine kinase
MTATPDRYILSIRDDGAGFPPQIDHLHTETLGLQLVRMLTEQIEGELRLDTTSGTEFVVEFPRPEPG